MGESIDAEDMRVLGDLVMRTARFLDMVSNAYTFFAYGLAVPSVFMLASSIFHRLGLGGMLAYNVAAWAGVLLGAMLSRLVPSRSKRYASRILGGRKRRLLVLFALLFILGYIGGSVPLYYLGLEHIAWYTGITAALILEVPLLYYAGERYTGESFLVSSLVAISGAPLVVVLGDEMAALAMLMLAYLAGGSWMVWRASRLFG